MEKAKKIYETVMKTFDGMGWTYDRYDEELCVVSGVKSDDHPNRFSISEYEKNQLIRLVSTLPFNVPEDKRIDIALAVCAISDSIIDGSFDYNIFDGEISFRLTSSYRESEISTDLIEYMIGVSTSTVDAYNDKLFAICKGYMTLEQLYEQLK